MIDHFEGEYAFLSNFYEFDPPIRVVFNGMNSLCYQGDVGEFNTTEAAYQAGKCSGKPNYPSNYERFTAREAKKIGKHETMSKKELEDWNTRLKFTLMKQILKKKFDKNHPDLQQKLLATGDEELIEGNYWHDTCWGVCDGVGENRLGKMLMEIREELKETANLQKLFLLRDLQEDEDEDGV